MASINEDELQRQMDSIRTHVENLRGGQEENQGNISELKKDVFELRQGMEPIMEVGSEMRGFFRVIGRIMKLIMFVSAFMAACAALWAYRRSNITIEGQCPPLTKRR